MSSGGVLKKVQLTNLVPPETISDRTEATIADGDWLLFSATDDSSAFKKVSPSDVLTPEAITGKSAIDAIADGDSLLVSDASASDALKKVSPSSILPPEAITGKSELTATASGDQLLIHDATAATVLKRVTLANLLPVYVSAETAIQAAGATETFTHGLGAVPRLVRLVLVCQSSDTPTAYGASDGEIDALAAATGSDGAAAFSISSNATTVNVLRDSVNLLVLKKKGTGVWTAVTSNANFKLKVYAFL